MTEPAAVTAPADAVRGSWVARAPAFARPYLQLSRYDRPVGFWLLALPCLIGLVLARIPAGLVAEDGWLALLFVIGAVAMRGAGCTYNDILDRDIDAKVARTALRPLPSGAVTLQQAWVWLLTQCAVGLAVLLALPDFAKLVALCAIPMVALYPLMKRITWWPQVWLGLTFNWGALVAPAAIRAEIALADWLLYAGLVLWTLGYDTIYAIQDREDDAMVGIGSSALTLGAHVKSGVAAFYAGAAALWGLAVWLLRPDWIALLALAPAALHLGWQVLTLEDSDGDNALARFRSNRTTGFLVAMACWVVGNA